MKRKIFNVVYVFLILFAFACPIILKNIMYYLYIMQSKTYEPNIWIVLIPVFTYLIISLLITLDSIFTNRTPAISIIRSIFGLLILSFYVITNILPYTGLFFEFGIDMLKTFEDKSYIWLITGVYLSFSSLFGYIKNKKKMTLIKNS